MQIGCFQENRAGIVLERSVFVHKNSGIVQHLEFLYLFSRFIVAICLYFLEMISRNL